MDEESKGDLSSVKQDYENLSINGGFYTNCQKGTINKMSLSLMILLIEPTLTLQSMEELLMSIKESNILSMPDS